MIWWRLKSVKFLLHCNRIILPWFRVHRNTIIIYAIRKTATKWFAFEYIHFFALHLLWHFFFFSFCECLRIQFICCLFGSACKLAVFEFYKHWKCKMDQMNCKMRRRDIVVCQAFGFQLRFVQMNSFCSSIDT